MISIVIPTLNVVGSLDRTLQSLAKAKASGLVSQVIVVDGGSTDGTQGLASREGAKVMTSAPGRGPQLGAGGDAVLDGWILFLHGDTALEPGWEAEAENFCKTLAHNDSAAAFRFAFDHQGRTKEGGTERRMEALVSWRSRVLGLPYGDQGFLISKNLYQRLGGFKPMPLMEDVNMVRRLKKQTGQSPVMLEARAFTSPYRFNTHPYYFLRSMRNLLCLALYYGGVPPRIVHAIYGK